MVTEINKSTRETDSALLAKRSAQIQRGGARAAVLGINDGLVSTLSIILAVTGAGSSQATVLVAGFAGLIAGAVSMAAGEWISVRSQVDLFEGTLGDLRKMVKSDRQLLTEQLSLNFEGNGISTPTAKAAAEEVSKDDEHLHEVYSSRILGINKDELGSPWSATISSFLLFTAGAIIALWPWFILENMTAVVASIVSTAIGGIATGAYVAYSSGKSQFYGALRQLIIVIFAAAVTYGVGYVFGVAIA